MPTVTIATRNGSQAHRAHNLRDSRVVEKADHIDPAGEHENWVDIPPREAYEQLFGKALEEYNAKQTDPRRKIADYYDHILKDKKKHPVYEMVIGVYPQGKGETINVEGVLQMAPAEITESTQKAILREFFDTWEKRNPNLKVIGAYYHADEEGEPHLHIDYIPVATGYKNSLKTQTGLAKALEQQGFQKNGKITAQIAWEKRENGALEEICERYGLTVIHPMVGLEVEHMDTERFKAQKRLEKVLGDINDLDEYKMGLEMANKRADGRLQRKLKVTKSKDKEKVTVNKAVYDSLRKELEDLKKELQIMHIADYQAQARYYQADKERAEAERIRKEEQRKIDQQKQELERQQQEFEQLVKKAAYEVKLDEYEELKSYCSKLFLENGKSVLAEYEEMQEIEQEKHTYHWSR